MKLPILAAGALSAATAQGVVVGSYATDWLNPDSTTGGITAGAPTLTGFTATAFSAGHTGSHTFVDVAATHGLTGQWIRALNSDGTSFSATIVLTDVPAFTSLSLNRMILLGGGGIDGVLHDDGFALTVNGQDVFDIAVAARNEASRFNGSYEDSAPAAAVLESAASDNTNGSEIDPTRTDGWGHDTLYDLGADPAFDDVAISGGGSVTIVLSGRLSNGLGVPEGGNTDEQVAIGNFEIVFNGIPEPSSFLLLGLGALGVFFRRRT